MKYLISLFLLLAAALRGKEQLEVLGSKTPGAPDVHRDEGKFLLPVSSAVFCSSSLSKLGFGVKKTAKSTGYNKCT